MGGGVECAVCGPLVPRTHTGSSGCTIGLFPCGAPGAITAAAKRSIPFASSAGRKGNRWDGNNQRVSLAWSLCAFGRRFEEHRPPVLLQNRCLRPCLRRSQHTKDGVWVPGGLARARGIASFLSSRMWERTGNPKAPNGGASRMFPGNPTEYGDESPWVCKRNNPMHTATGRNPILVTANPKIPPAANTTPAASICTRLNRVERNEISPTIDRNRIETRL